MQTLSYQLMGRKIHSIYFNFIKHFSNLIQFNTGNLVNLFFYTGKMVPTQGKF